MMLAYTQRSAYLRPRDTALQHHVLDSQTSHVTLMSGGTLTLVISE